MTVTDLPDDTLLKVQDLQMHFPAEKDWCGRTTRWVKAVDEVSFTIRRGETFGIVGESGSGKSTAARAILRAYKPTGGSVRFKDPSGTWHELTDMNEDGLRPLRRHMQMIFQDPYSSLNPRMTIEQLIGEPMINQGITDATIIRDRAAELLVQVGLRPEALSRYPHAFSGGQRQRVGIARALATNPTFIAADESVSALDVSIAAQTINLMQDLQEELGLTYMFITHDLSMVEHISDRIGVMYAGRLLEVSDTDSFFARPLHPYSEALLSAIPVPDPRRARKSRGKRVKGEVPDPANLPPGCAFAQRCPYATDRCTGERPTLRHVAPGRYVRCHFADELQLEGPKA